MGLGKNEQGSVKFVTIVVGKFTVRVPEGTMGSVARTMTKEGYEGKVVYELYYDHIDGELIQGHIKDGNFGQDLCLKMRDGEETFIVQIPVNSGYFEAFAKCVPNIDPTQWLFLGLGYDKEKDKHFLYIRQGKDGSTKIHSAYTKDNPNGLPPAVQKKEMGKTKWDFTEQKNFLYESVIDWLGVAEDEAPF